MAQRLIRKNRKGVLHFLDLNVRDFRPAFRQDCFARMVVQELRRQCDLHPAKLIAYVVMPTHLHANVNPRDGDAIRFVKNYIAAVTLAYDKIAEEHHWQAIRNWLTRLIGIGL